MDLQTLTSFFMWCTILNVGLMMLWTSLYLLAPDFTYRMQSKFFPISQATFEVVFYSFLGLYKILVIVFCMAPWISLLIIG